jgi:UDP-glucose:(heptosyl)LPS alpha-1,3-glucosyltransferase
MENEIMNIALCYENVNPARGGCETYIADITRKLCQDGHTVHLYACQWDATALPPLLHYHRIPAVHGPRSMKPWTFAQAVLDAMKTHKHDVTIGFDKTYGQDILYPQGGLHVASAHQNTLKYRPGLKRWWARLVKKWDPASRSFQKLERRQYLSRNRPRIVVNSKMVQGHFEKFYDIPADEVTVLPSAIDPNRFLVEDRLKRRADVREGWGFAPETPVGLFVAMNYRLKGLAPLIQSLRLLEAANPFRLVVVGHPKFVRYQKLAMKLGVSERIQFAGFQADTKDAYFASDFLVHPTFYDPCSLVALEAMACGLPVITTVYNGASELYKHGEEGLVISDPHHSQELADAITKLCNNSTRSAMSAAARQAAKRWQFSLHYQKLLGLMQQVAKVKQAA